MDNQDLEKAHKKRWEMKNPIGIFAHVYEMGKKHPVAVILDDGRYIEIDPWDVEEMNSVDTLMDTGKDTKKAK